MLHETWHYHAASIPRAIDYKEGLLPCYDLAREKGAEIAHVNADSLTFDGLAIYIHQTFKSLHAPTVAKHLELLRAPILPNTECV
jgi:hypothetical protein